MWRSVHLASVQDKPCVEAPIFTAPAIYPSGVVCLCLGFLLALCVEGPVYKPLYVHEFISITSTSCITGSGDLIVLFPLTSLSAHSFL